MPATCAARECAAGGVCHPFGVRRVGGAGADPTRLAVLGLIGYALSTTLTTLSC
jgi:hypothetical protein